MKHPPSCVWLGCVIPALLAILGCSSTSEPASGDPRIDLKSGDPRVRILATRKAAEAGGSDLLEELAAALSDPDPAVRMFADISLRKLTSQDFDFKPHGTFAEREEARGRWALWIAARKPKPTDAAPAAAPGTVAPSTALKEEAPDAEARRD